MAAADSRYIRKHLSDYVKFQISQGYSKDDVADVLRKYGYKDDMLAQIMNDPEMSKVRRKQAHHHVRDMKKMSKELYIYIQDLLINFIIREKEQGYNTAAIRKALINYGHQPEIVDAAIEAVENDEHTVGYTHKNQITGISPGIIFSVNVLIILLLVVFIAVSTSSDLLIILLSFFPVILSLTVMYVVLQQVRTRNAANLMVFAGLAMTVLIFVAMLQIKSPMLDLSEPNTVLVMNIILSLLLGSMQMLFSRLPRLGAPADKPLPVEHVKLDKDARLEHELDHGSDELQAGSKKLEDLIGKKPSKNSEKENSAKPVGSRAKKPRPGRLKIKAI